ncbi:MAG: hypothetical protein GXN93_04715 [Candidatus Diapherotrites archaeon]|nr:hypothetical protein [Candidatus Diapherotrites archaeon]
MSMHTTSAPAGSRAAVLFLGHNTGCVVLPENFLDQDYVAQGLANPLKPFVGFLCPEGATVLKNKLVDWKAFVMPAKKPDCLWLIPDGFQNGLPNITFVEGEFSGGREVEVFRPGVAVVDYELQICYTRLILAAVVYALPSNVPKNDRPLLRLSCGSLGPVGRL